MGTAKEPRVSSSAADVIGLCTSIVLITGFIHNRLDASLKQETHPPLEFLRSPSELWASHPTLLIGECFAFLSVASSIWHALNTHEFQRMLLCVAFSMAGISSLVTPGTVALQAQGTVMISDGLPLRVVCHHTASLYVACVCALRLELPPLPAAAASGLLCTAFEWVYFIVGSTFFWWRWDGDSQTETRCFGTPLSVVFWAGVSAFSVALTLRLVCSPYTRLSSFLPASPELTEVDSWLKKYHNKLQHLPRPVFVILVPLGVFYITAVSSVLLQLMVWETPLTVGWSSVILMLGAMGSMLLVPWPPVRSIETDANLHRSSVLCLSGMSLLMLVGDPRYTVSSEDLRIVVNGSGHEQRVGAPIAVLTLSLLSSAACLHCLGGKMRGRSLRNLPMNCAYAVDVTVRIGGILGLYLSIMALKLINHGMLGWFANGILIGTRSIASNWLATCHLCWGLFRAEGERPQFLNESLLMLVVLLVVGACLEYHYKGKAGGVYVLIKNRFLLWPVLLLIGFVGLIAVLIPFQVFIFLGFICLGLSGIIFELRSHLLQVGLAKYLPRALVEDIASRPLALVLRDLWYFSIDCGMAFASSVAGSLVLKAGSDETMAMVSTMSPSDQAVLARPLLASCPGEMTNLFYGRATAEEEAARQAAALPRLEISETPVDGDSDLEVVEGEDGGRAPEDEEARERRRIERQERKARRRARIQAGVESIMDEAHEAGGPAINTSTGTLVFRQADPMAIAKAIVALRLRKLFAPLQKQGGKLLAAGSVMILSLCAMAVALVRIRRGQGTVRELMMALSVVIAALTGTNLALWKGQSVAAITHACMR